MHLRGIASLCALFLCTNGVWICLQCITKTFLVRSCSTHCSTLFVTFFNYSLFDYWFSLFDLCSTTLWIIDYSSTNTLFFVFDKCSTACSTACSTFLFDGHVRPIIRRYRVKSAGVCQRGILFHRLFVSDCYAEVLCWGLVLFCLYSKL